MKTNIKLALPKYMVIVSIFYIIVIAIINQEFIANSIGSDLDVKISFLSIVIFSNTSYLEKTLNNEEIFYLLPDRLKRREFIKRFIAKYIFIFILSELCYCLYFCKDRAFIFMNKEPMTLFFESSFCVLCSIFFWGNTTCFIIHKVHNAWIGIGLTGAIWFLLNTTFNIVLQQKIPIYFNIYSNMVTDKNGYLVDGWIYGKMFEVILGGVIFVVNFVFIYNSKNARRVYSCK